MKNRYRLARRPGEWLREKGPQGDVVISSRIRLARNVQGYPFAAKLNQKKALQLIDFLQSAVLQSCRPHPLKYLNIGSLEPTARRVLVERHLISREHAKRSFSHGVAIGPEEIISVMMNEEDHLRIQVLRSGWRPREAFQAASEIDRKLSENLPYARSSQYGFLTSCPTNAGTGLRLSAMVHLPALVLNAKIEKTIMDCEEMGLEVRGLYGEGSRAYGDLFQVSNRVTLGFSEEEILAQMDEKIQEVMAWERRERRRLLKESKNRILAHVQNTIGGCTTSSVVSSAESMRAISLLRLGIHLKLYRKLPLARINELFLWTQPGHIQHLVGKGLRRIERDHLRAQLVRRWCARHLPQMS